MPPPQPSSRAYGAQSWVRSVPLPFAPAGQCLPACLSSMPSSPPGVVSLPLPRPHTNSPSLLGDVGASPLNSCDTRHSVPSTVTRPLFEHGPLLRAGTRFPHLRVSSTCSVGSSQLRSECPWTDHRGRRVPRCCAYWQCPVQSERRRGSLPQPVSGSILYQDTPKWEAMHVLWAGLLSGRSGFPRMPQAAQLSHSVHTRRYSFLAVCRRYTARRDPAWVWP